MSRVVVCMKGSITAYRMGTQFSMVTHWKTVNMASPMLSKEVMPGEQNSYEDPSLKESPPGLSPALGPGHFSRQTETFVSHRLAPQGASVGLPRKQGDPTSPSVTTSSGEKIVS